MGVSTISPLLASCDFFFLLLLLLLVITLYPQNQQSGGWKSENYVQCITKEGDRFIECIEDNSYYNYGSVINDSNFVEEKYYYAGRLYDALLRILYTCHTETDFD